MGGFLLGGGVGEDFSFASGFSVKPSPNCPAYMTSELGVREPSPADVQGVAYPGHFIFWVSGRVDQMQSENSSDSEFVNDH